MKKKPPEKKDGKKKDGKKKEAFSPMEKRVLSKAFGLSCEPVACCRGDMDEDMHFADVWIWFDDAGLYVALGEEEILPAKRKKRGLDPQITVHRTVRFAADEVDKLVCERFVSTGRLYFEKDEANVFEIGFSMSRLKDVDRFTGAFNSYRETGEVKLEPDDDDEEGVCKKCGAPCEPGKDYCKKHTKNSATAIRLFRFFGGYIPQIVIIILVMLSGSVLSVFLPQLSTRQLFDKVLSDGSGASPTQLLAALGTLVLTVFGLRLLNTALTSFRLFIQGSVMPNVIYDIKVKIFKAMQRLSVGFYASTQTGALMERVMRDATNIYWFFVDGIPDIIIEVSTIIGVLTVMFIMNPQLSLIVVLVAPAVLVILIFSEKFFLRLHHRSWIYNSKVSSMVSDNVAGQREIKAFAKEDREYERFSKLSGEYRNAELKLALTEATVFPLAEIVIVILTAVVLGMGGTMVAKQQMTTGTLLSYIVYLEMLREPFEFLSWISNWWSRCADSAQRVFEIVDSEEEIKEKEDAVSPETCEGTLEIKDLDFEYEPARPIIQDFNLKVEAGRMLGIVGKTGAGKSTIANLIARLYDPKKGSITLDGHDIRDLKFEYLRKNIGIVSQDIYLFMGTVADNIRYAKPDAGMDEVIAAAKAASAHDFIMKLPDAYETRIGSGGQKLSGGETQRVSIARTIIQNPKVLILDEATAAMDTETERNIQASLTKLKAGRTTLAIAHRLSTLRDADMLAVIDKGSLIEYGTFVELLQKKGEFYKQYKLQSEALKSAGIMGDATGDDDDEEED